MSIEGLKLKNVFYRDLERCPFLPKDEGYKEWTERNNKRLEIISENRTKLAHDVDKYLSHPDRTVRAMAHLLDFMLEK